jgi:hypothetical protein
VILRTITGWIGFLLIAIGLGCIYWPLAIIATGVTLVVAALFGGAWDFRLNH